MQLTTSAPCRPNTAYTIGGVSWAAKRRIQRKALHRCRSKKQLDVPHKIQYLDSQHYTDELDNCYSTMCPQDICEVDKMPRRQIGDNCCACPEELHNCYTREVWSAKKKEWCCKYKQRGCSPPNFTYIGPSGDPTPAPAPPTPAPAPSTPST